MQHRIETNVSAQYIGNVALALRRKCDVSEMINVTVFCTAGSNVVVEVNGNGSFLRDVCFALDVAGMLD